MSAKQPQPKPAGLQAPPISPPPPPRKKSTGGSSGKPDPAALTARQLAELLTQAGSQKIAEKKIRELVAAGAPANGDDTIHLIRFTAWLAGQVE